MISKLATLVVFVFGASTLACGGERTPATSALQTQENAVLTVENTHWLDVTLYAIRAGTRHRIGTVGGQQTDTIPLRNTILGGAATVRLLVEPIGSAQTHLTEPIPIGPKEWIQLQIRNPLNLSTFAVSRR